MTGKILLLAAAMLLAAVPVRAEDIKAPDMSPPDAWQARQEGNFRVMNKIDSTVQLVQLHVGAALHIQSLTLTLSGCFVRPPDLPEDAAAHVTITDSRDAAHHFDGWMLQKEPALSMLEHPVYDVQLAGCS